MHSHNCGYCIAVFIVGLHERVWCLYDAGQDINISVISVSCM